MRLRLAVLAAAAAAGVFAVKLSDNSDIERIGAADNAIVKKESKFVPSPVYAAINYNGVLYEDEALTKAVDYLKTGDRVEVLADKTRKVYYIRHGNRLGWAEAAILNIPADERTLTDRLTAEEIEEYAADEGFKSDTDYFVFVDIARQRTYVLKYDKNNVLRLERDIVCATGKNTSPTTRGSFKISQRGESFYNARLESGARFWVRFNGSYLFHSIALNEDGTVKDGLLGTRRSDGCVRMSMTDIEWFYNTVPEGTAVRVY